MKKYPLRVISPKKILYEGEAVLVTAPGADGELTVLYNHAPLFCLLREGVVTVRSESEEHFFSIGGGYLETTGKQVNLLVSKAYGQDELDEEEVKKAQARAEEMLKSAPSETERKEASMMLRRSFVDLKLLRKTARRKRPITS